MIVHRTRVGVWMGVAMLLLWCGGVTDVAAQRGPDAITERDVRPLAEFGDARSLGVDPRGRIYVTDARSNAVTILDPRGRVLEVLGGTGRRATEFDEPADLDPTNGLAFWVADAGNGRLQQFSDDLRFLEALPVGRVDPGGGLRSRQPAFDVGRDGNDVRADGRPVAVVTSSANDVFAIDAREGVVLAWDARRRQTLLVERGRRQGVVQDPVALAIAGDRRLFVADRGLEAVMAFDLFGSFLTRIQPEPMPDVRALATHDGMLWIVRPSRIYVCHPDGRVEHTLDVDLGAPLIDVQPTRRGIFLLTATQLVVAPALR